MQFSHYGLAFCDSIPNIFDSFFFRIPLRGTARKGRTCIRFDEKNLVDHSRAPDYRKTTLPLLYHSSGRLDVPHQTRRQAGISGRGQGQQTLLVVVGQVQIGDERLDALAGDARAARQVF